jgi:AAA15 family ATPase/GTPase
MLLEFTVGNFLSFKEKKTFSLEAGSISEHKENVVKEGKYKVLRSAVIYGANSSGKSNFVKALEFMVNTIKNSSKLNSTDKLNVTPFLLNIKTQNEPSYFEIVYLRLGLRYRYGFEIDNEKVCSEWLYILENDSKKEDLYFVRSTEGIGVADIFYEARIFVDNTRNNGLFLSLLDQLNIKTSKDVMSSFTSIHIRSGIEHSESAFMTDTLYQRQDYQNDVKNFIYHLNLGFNRFHIDNDKEISFKNRFKTFHKLYNNNGNVISDFEFSLSKNESSGTNKIFDLAGYIVLALKFGSLVLIDELDSKLHPILTQEIIKLFNNPETNPKNAQLIFTTHDTNLLGANLFRRDQVWFTEKDDFEATDLYSLLEFKDEDGKTIRKDRSFEKDYIRGRYGAIPYITNFQEI